MESLDKLAVHYLSVLNPSNLTTHHGRRRKCPTRQYEPDSKTAPASTSPLDSRVDAYAVAASRDGPEDSRSFFSLDVPPPLLMRRRLSPCAAASIATPPPLSSRQCLFHCASLSPAVGCCIVTFLAAPVPLLSCRRLSRCTATSLVAPRPLLWRLTCAGWLLLRQLS